VTIPGANLLRIAMGPIRRQTVGYLQWTGKAVNVAGKEEDTFAASVDITGSFQPLDRKRAQAMGLDVSKSYATFYGFGNVQPVKRDTGADRVTFGGRKYSAVGDVNWMEQDGWKAALLVDVGPA
jgi:hypothetical protein